MSNLEKLRFLLSMAAADGAITQEELRLFGHRALQWGITDDQFEQLLDEAASGDAAELHLPEGKEERVDLLKDMVLMMAADGQLHHTERIMFAVVAGRMGVTELELNMLIDSVIAENS